MSEVTPRDREEKLLAAIAEGATGKLPTPRNRKEKLLKEIYDNGGTGGGGITPAQVKTILLDNTDTALNGASSNPIANKALVAALADYVKSTDLSIPTKVSELINDKKYQTDSDLITALTPYAKSDDVTAEIIAEIAKVVADAPESFDTLKEMADWIAHHEDDASAMNSAISDNKTSITALQTGKADKSEIPTTVAELTDSADYAKKTDLHSHDNKSVLDGITSDKVTYWDNKSEFSGSYNDLNDKPTIDAELSNTSENAIQNKVVTKEINKLYSDISFNDHDTATSGTSFTDAEDGNMIVTDWTKNLLKPTLETTTQNGITCTNNGDGTYTLNGTCTNTFELSFNPVLKLPYGKYKLLEIDAFQKTNNGEWIATIMSGDVFEVSESKPVLDVMVFIGSGSVVNETIKPMLTTDLSATYDDFVPYGGYEIQSCGKNLMSVNDATNGDTLDAQDRFNIRIRGLDKGNIASDRIYFAKKGVMGGHNSFTFEITKDEPYGIVINHNGSTNDIDIEYINYMVRKGTYTISFDVASNSPNVECGLLLHNIQLEHGDTETDFEPYTGETITVTNDTEAPAFGLKSHKGITNIISPGNVKCVYPTNKSGKGVLDSLYNKDKMLTEQNKSLEVLGKCKNLLNPTIDTDTHNGITFTRNDDGTYSLSGSRIDTSSSAYLTFITNLPLEKGKYKLIGAVDENNFIRCIVNKPSRTNIYDYGDGCILDVNETGIAITLMIVTTDNTSQTRVIKPMLTTNLSATYDDFVPYTGDGDTLTHDVAEIKNDLGGLSFSSSGTTLTITDGTNTWTLEANS